MTKQTALATLDDQMELPIGFTTEGLGSMNDTELLNAGHSCIKETGKNIGALALVYAESVKRKKGHLFIREFPYIDTKRLEQIAQNLIHAAFFAAPQHLVNIIRQLPMSEQRRIVDGTLHMADPKETDTSKPPKVKPLAPQDLVDPKVRDQVIGQKPEGQAYIRKIDEQLKVREQQRLDALERERVRKAIEKKAEQRKADEQAAKAAESVPKEANAIPSLMQKGYHFDRKNIIIHSSSTGYRIPLSMWLDIARECVRNLGTGNQKSREAIVSLLDDIVKEQQNL